MISLICGLLLIGAISIEFLGGDHLHFSQEYLLVQFVVCCVFLLDFSTRWLAVGCARCFFWHNWAFLLLSIPYLNIVVWSGIQLSREWALLMSVMPLLTAFLAMHIVVRWLVSGRVRQLLVAYIFTVVGFTYLVALMFYDYEILVNPDLHRFGDALWWAWMNATTVGAAIYPVTAVGKVLTVLLPIMGMMMFPIFTIYITTVCVRK
ncbi:MAG: two pore domain potassium channel family protein [Alistipes sp.]